MLRPVAEVGRMYLVQPYRDARRTYVAKGAPSSRLETALVGEGEPESAGRRPFERKSGPLM